MTQWSDYSTGQRIKMLRAGMTQEELAEAAGVSVPTVRKAEKEGVCAEVSTSAEAIEVYYGLHCETRRKHGVPPQPFSFFQNIFRNTTKKDNDFEYKGICGKKFR